MAVVGGKEFDFGAFKIEALAIVCRFCITFHNDSIVAQIPCFSRWKIERIVEVKKRVTILKEMWYNIGVASLLQCSFQF